MALTPISKPGGTALQYYAETDFIGVESSPTGATDHRGANEALDWTLRANAALIEEHYSNGVHDTLRAARAIVHVYYDTVLGYTMKWFSYCQSTAGVVTLGTGAAGVARTGAGAVTVTLTHAMPSNTYRIKDMSFGAQGATDPTRVHVGLESITSTTVFAIRRWSGTSFSTLAAADGEFSIAVYDA